MEVTNAFNSNANIYRNKDSLMKMWEKWKSESKLYYARGKRKDTDDGASTMDPIMEQVCSILGRACTGILGVPDSDAVGDIGTHQSIIDNVTVNGNYDDLDDTKLNEVSQLDATVSPMLEVIITEEDKKSDHDSGYSEINNKHINFPMWSRRRPNLLQLNGKSEDESNVYANVIDIKRKKQNLEDLNLQLLQEEKEFKRKLYDIQLQTATKELEIKTAILEQIKGGGMTAVQTLYGVQFKTE